MSAQSVLLLPTLGSARRPTRAGVEGGGLQHQHQREDAAGSKIWGLLFSLEKLNK